MTTKQSYWQFLRKFVVWGWKDLRRHYQPLKYSEVKGPEYHRPIGYDDRPLYRKAICPYAWARAIDQISSGLITYYYDNRVYFHKRFPNHVENVKGPIESYLPPRPKRFPDEFIKSERDRMKKFKLPPNEYYDEFDADPVQEELDDSPSLFDMGKSFRDRMVKKAIFQTKKIDITGMTSTASSEASKLLTDERKQALKGALETGQGLTQRAIKGDLKGAAWEAKSLLDANVRNNQALKDSAKEKATALQEVVTSFVRGYDEGKKYEEIAQTDPKELLKALQQNAKKAVFVVAKDAPDLLTTTSAGDLKSKLTNMADKARNLDKVEMTKEDEEQLKRDAEAWLKAQTKTVQDAAQAAKEQLASTREFKMAQEAGERAAARTKETGAKVVEQVQQESKHVQNLAQDAKGLLTKEFHQVESKVKKMMDEHDESKDKEKDTTNEKQTKN